MKCVILFLLLSCLHPAQAQESGIQTLSQEIHVQLDSLKQQSRLLTEQLLAAESELEQSSMQVEALKKELDGLNSCLDATNEKLTSYSAQLIVYEERLKVATRLNIFAAVFIIVLCALYIIYNIVKSKLCR